MNDYQGFLVKHNVALLKLHTGWIRKITRLKEKAGRNTPAAAYINQYYNLYIYVGSLLAMLWYSPALCYKIVSLLISLISWRIN